MRVRVILFAVGLMLMPLAARAADLVVWWEEGFNPEEDTAVKEIVAGFEQKTGKQVELILYPQTELPDKLIATGEAGSPPDFAFGQNASSYIMRWAFDGWLVDLSDALGDLVSMFDAEVLNSGVLFNSKTGQKALYGVPIGLATTHLHVWKSLLEQAGFTLADIPKQWDAFWPFWCDQVQPAVRQATGRNDIWGVGLTMSAETFDGIDAFFQFVAAYDADYVTRDGRLVIDDPEIRQRLVKALASYTAIYRKGCTPPGSVTWGNIDNNKQFLDQAIVMTPNLTLSIPNTIKRERPEDYHKNIATIEWPLGPSGKPFPIVGFVFAATVFKDGGHTATAEEFVRFLVGEGWLAHYLDFAGERMLPPLPTLLQSPFWLDPSDPHHLASAMQVASRPQTYNYAVVSGDWRHDRIRYQEHVWGDAVHRVITEGITPEQAANEAIARVKQILSE